MTICKGCNEPINPDHPDAHDGHEDHLGEPVTVWMTQKQAMEIAVWLGSLHMTTLNENVALAIYKLHRGLKSTATVVDLRGLK